MRFPLPSSLFARTFLLIAIVLVLSAAASLAIYRLYEREPRSRELAQQVISTVNLTRAALIAADPELRRALLLELNDREGLRVLPMAGGETVTPLEDDPLLARVTERIRMALGAETRFATAHEDEEGFWVSFRIDDDEFWVALPPERFDTGFGLGWLGAGLALLAAALAAGWWTAFRISRPLDALASAARRLGRGEAPDSLAETGPRELRSVAESFNRMAGSLHALERERATVLAGISHDLRTPLARMKLELEMSGASRAAIEGITRDIDEIDAVIGQFLDFARGEDEPLEAGDPGALLGELIASFVRRGRRVALHREPGTNVRFAPAALRRAVSNLIENALRYAGEPVEVRLEVDSRAVRIDVLDRGPGISPADAERLKQPFTRADVARAGAIGSGLGLAIVERVARIHGGRLELLPRDGGGLCARIEWPSRG